MAPLDGSETGGALHRHAHGFDMYERWSPRERYDTRPRSQVMIRIYVAQPTEMLVRYTGDIYGWQDEARVLQVR